MLYRSTDRRCRRGAPVKNLSHSASFESLDKNAPSKAGTKHLEGLVDLARERGAAIGVASASPAMVESLTRWADALEAKGVALVPLSALMLKSSGSQARAKP